MLSLLERGTQESELLQHNLHMVPPSSSVVTTIITYEEQMRGWLAFAALQNDPERLTLAYQRLQVHIATFENIPLLPFDLQAAHEFSVLKISKIQVGTMDLRIAAIALANNATVISRNLRHFPKVTNLQVEDWS